MTTTPSPEFAERINEMVETLVRQVLTGPQMSPSEKAHTITAQLRMLGMLPVDAEWASFNPMGQVVPEQDAETAARHAELLSAVRRDLPAVPLMRYVSGYQKVTSGRNPAEYDGSPVCPVCLSGWAKPGQIGPNGLPYTVAETSCRYFADDRGTVGACCSDLLGAAA